MERLENTAFIIERALECANSALHDSDAEKALRHASDALKCFYELAFTAKPCSQELLARSWSVRSAAHAALSAHELAASDAAEGIDAFPTAEARRIHFP